MLGGDTYSREPEDELMMNMMDFDQGLKQKSAIEQMIQLWIREDAVPELMPFDYDVCELVTQKLEEQVSRSLSFLVHCMLALTLLNVYE
jgi:hypothetical protein